MSSIYKSNAMYVMGVCPSCGTWSVPVDNVCLNCKGVVTYKLIKEYGFLDFARQVALLVSVGVSILLGLFFIMEVM